MYKLFLLLLFALPIVAQTQHSHGAGAPSGSDCNAARKYGRVYDDVSVDPPVEYTCGSGGWKITSAGDPPAGCPGAGSVQLYATSSTFGCNANLQAGVSISAPSAPSVTTQGMAGMTTAKYAVCVSNGVGLRCGSPTTITTSNAVIDDTNFNRIVLPNIPGRTCYVFRYQDGIGDPNGDFGPGLLYDKVDPGAYISHLCDGSNFDDVGYLGDYVNSPSYAPPVDTSAAIGISGFIRGGNAWVFSESPDLEIPAYFRNIITDASASSGVWHTDTIFTPTADLGVGFYNQYHVSYVIDAVGMGSLTNSTSQLFLTGTGSISTTDSNCNVALVGTCTDTANFGSYTFNGNVYSAGAYLNLCAGCGATTVTEDVAGLWAGFHGESPLVVTGVAAGVIAEMDNCGAFSSMTAGYCAGVYARAGSIAVTPGAFQRVGGGQTAPIIAALDSDLSVLASFGPSGIVSSPLYQGNGAAPGISGCGASVTVGTNIGGLIASGTTGTCTIALTFTATATTGYNCDGWSDVTNTPALFTGLAKQTAVSSTSCTVQLTTVSGDVIRWTATPY